MSSTMCAYSMENLKAFLRKQACTVEDYKWLQHYFNHADDRELKLLMHDEYMQQSPALYNEELPFSTEILEKIHSKLNKTTFKGNI
ncbi:hypothetical protein CLV57_3170 [Mucilaginibacter auburnensis]|uniref:Uncharacterized protein n=2 Tax=Mucilaginibacter auburnensis TaxID=1457233 RepID=A0A2H9VNY0_9SPHI|nr:hypothetical protein CLV57_3170 [Mucilaginibacter auburnensis]